MVRLQESTQPIVVDARRWPRYLRRSLITLLLLGLLLIGLFGTGLIHYEHQRGFFAPAWGPDGAVYFIERETSGVQFGVDWKDFGRPRRGTAVWSWIWNDQISIRRLEPDSRQVRTLRVWADTPVNGRLIRVPAESAFGILLATLNTSGGLTFTANVSVPATAPYENLEDQQKQQLFTGRADNVVRHMREVMAVPGELYYPAAIVSTINNQDYKVLLHNKSFGKLYPDGIAPELLKELSRRGAIQEQARVLDRRAALIKRYVQQGLDRDEATAKAEQDLARDGYQVVAPRLIATAISAPSRGDKVFTISKTEFDAGYFSDIAAAISQPGVAVKKSAEAYSSETGAGRALNQWVENNQISWVVAVDSNYYRLLILY